MLVRVACREDIPSWLRLAAEVEFLFGPMVGDPGFHAALERSIDRGTAYCVRRGDGDAGVPLVGGLLFSAHPPVYTIGWLAVSRRFRRHGAGRLLVEHALSLVEPPAEVVVTTFGKDIVAGRPARRFYERMGFRPAEKAPPGPDGGSHQIYRLLLPARADSNIAGG
jgi:GNAT superfamily N-acetyltransferase